MTRPPKTYRGSRARLNRVKLLPLTPVDIWILIAVTLAGALGVLAWLAGAPD